MKFHCERCKTKYSISDDRVRGKILKIRCKNCSSVITVREPKGAAKAKAPAIPAAAKRPLAKAKARVAATTPAPVKASSQPSSAGQRALAGAFKEAVNEPDSSAANMQAQSSPVSLEADWYLSKDGHQEGPFSMEAAHAWVSAKDPEDELYCWSEGFDDWLPTEKISHFRGIRASSFSDLDSPDEQTMIDGALPFTPPVETPKPLFAATMAAVAASESVALDDEVHLPTSAAAAAAPIPAASAAPPIPAASATPPPASIAGGQAPMFAPTSTPTPTPTGGGAAPAMDLAIGEASRVVDLAALMATRGNAPPNGAAHAGLPGTTRALGAGTGMAPTVGNPSGGYPTLGPEAGMPLAPLGGLGTKRKRRTSLILTLVGASIAIALGAGILVYIMQDSGNGRRLVRGSVGGSDSLGHSSKTNPTTTNPTGKVDKPEDVVAVVDPKTPRIRRPTGGPRGRPIKVPIKPTNGSGEVDLTNSSKGPATGPLDPDEFMQMVRKRDYIMKMCYERSLKKDPLLKVPKSRVDIRVGTNGRVSSVRISAISGTPLGICLTKSIKRWKFRELTESFSGQFPLLFGR